MTVQRIQFDQLQEDIYYEQMPNGLRAYVLPKSGFYKTYATFTTNYGSVDNHFVTIHGEEMRVPDGIAHFLEHKMFEEEDGDVFQQFSRYGASANAFTSFDRTAYLFSCTDHVSRNLETLLDFVQHPYFTHENVEKEKGIIEQEIRMYQDNPDWRAFFGLLHALYERHPVKIDIAGTVDSIYDISKQLLDSCYETFYHPTNMLVFVVGGVDPHEILALIRNNQDQKSFPDPEANIQRLFEQEPERVHVKEHQVDLGIGIPKCMIGVKETNTHLKGEAFLRQEVTSELLLDVLFGNSSSFYQQLMEDGIIDDSFGADYQLEHHYGFSVIGGNTKDPEQLIARVQDYAFRNDSVPFSAEDVERSRKKKIGAVLNGLNSPEFIANQFTRYQFHDVQLLDVVPLLETITFDEVSERMRDHFQESRMASNIVR